MIEPNPRRQKKDRVSEREDKRGIKVLRGKCVKGHARTVYWLEQGEKEGLQNSDFQRIMGTP
jgi:hypothetical protein